MEEKETKHQRFSMRFYDDQMKNIKIISKQEGFSTVSNFVRSLVINHVNSKLKK